MDRMSFDTKRIAEGYKKRPFLHKQVIEKVKNCVNKPYFELGLDIGCGAGLSAKALRLICKRVIGTDVSQEMINAAYEVCKDDPALSFVVSRAEDFTMDARADIVTAAGSLPWIEWELFLKNLTHLLAAEGYLVIYDFAISDEMKGNTEYKKWWHEQYLTEFPRPYRKEQDWTEADVNPFGFHIVSKETLELEYSFTQDSFLEFMMIQSNVNIQIEQGYKSSENVKKWFEMTLPPIFHNEVKTVIFKGYLWLIQKME